MNDDLTSVFRDIDHAADFAVFSSCLELVGSIPFCAEPMRESNDLLGATPGRSQGIGCCLPSRNPRVGRIANATRSA